MTMLLLLIACDNDKSKEGAPSILLTEQQMVDVMIDVQIIEQSINYRRGRNQSVTNLKQRAYDTIFSHYGITDSIFIENLNYYNTNDLPKMKSIVDTVNAYFTTKQEEIKKKKWDSDIDIDNDTDNDFWL